MKYTVLTLAAILSSSIPAQAQEPVVRESRFGRGRITEIAPERPVVVAHEFVATDEPPAKPDAPKPEAGDPKAPPAASKPTPVQPVDPRTGFPQTRSGEVEMRDAINEAQLSYAAAIRSLNPSYAIAPVIGRSAASGGSFYIRTTAVPVVRTTNLAPAGSNPNYYQSGYYSPDTAALVPLATLPRPLVFGGANWTGYPDWLYSGTVQVDMPRIAVEDPNVTALREEVRRLRAQVDDLNKRLPPQK